MEKVKIKFLLIFFLTALLCLIIHNKAYAASMNMSISKSSAYVGDTFSVTISGVNGRVYISSNSNVTISASGSQFVDGSLTIKGTAKSVGTGTITVTPEDVVTNSANPQEVTSVASRSITIKEKEVKQETTAKTETTKTETTKTTKKTSTKSTSNSTRKTAENNEETKKSENFYISTLVLNGINEKGEYIELKLTPEFSKDIYEYECNITSDIQKIEIQKDAGEFTDSIVITGLEEIKEGENIIKIELIEEGYETKTYTIKVIKDKEEEIEAVNENVTEESNIKETKMISMPLWVFILVETILVLIILTESIAIYVMLKKKRIRKSLI